MPSFIFSQPNQYLNSVLHDATTDGHDTQSETAMQRHAKEIPHQCPYLKAFRGAQIKDILLSQAGVARWTRVIPHEGLLKRLLHDYFLYQYSWTAFFHKEFFLDDMRRGRTRFCSQLLVNAVLASACHITITLPHRAHFWNPRNLGYRFLVEAKRLWEIAILQEPVHLTTIQAGLILNLVSNLNGTDKIGFAYLEETIRLSQVDDLFHTDGEIKDRKVRESRTLTAWSLYAWQSVQAYDYLRAPWIQDPPLVPLPDLQHELHYSDNLQIVFPPSQIPHSLLLADTINAHFTFGSIVNALATELFAGSATELTAQQIFHHKDNLDEWYARLPDRLTPRRLTFPDHLLIHMDYHGTIAKLMQPLPVHQIHSVARKTSSDTVDHTMEEAELHLETVIRLYYLRHSFDDYSPRLVKWLAFLGIITIERLKTRSTAISDNDVVMSDSSEETGFATSGQTEKQPTARELRSTLILCAKGLFSQGQCYHLAVPVFRALKDLMAPEDVHLLMTYIVPSEDDSDEQPLMPQYLQSQWPMPIIGLDEDPRPSRLGKLVGKYAKSSLGTVSGDDE